MSHPKFPYLGEFARLVPQEVAGNLVFRRKVMAKAASSEEFRRDEWIRCSRDLFYYLNVYGWVYEPRIPAKLPFCLWDYQYPALSVILEAIGTHDLGVEKSRDMGATWMCLAAMEWQWHFLSMRNFLLVSRKEDLVDRMRENRANNAVKEGGGTEGTGDPNTLFSKIDFLLDHLPAWLKPRMRRRRAHLQNLDTGSTIDGEATTGDVGAGGRSTAILLDEFARVKEGDNVIASTQANTNCRIFLSTPQGTGNAYYTQLQKMQAEGQKVLTLHWSLHPLKRSGIWEDTNKQGRFKFRSPWYDEEVKRFVHPVQVAQELDIDYQGSSYCFFPEDTLSRLLKDVACPPYQLGEVSYTPNGDFQGFQPRVGGRLKLWCNPDAHGRMPQDRSYVIGCDIAAGSQDASGRGASLSCAMVGDCKTGEKVGELALHGVFPDEFARMVHALAKWFKGDSLAGGAYVIWDAPGAGQQFSHVLVKQLGYGNVYFRKKDDTVKGTITDSPGFWSNKNEQREALLGSYRTALNEGSMINRSSDALSECRYYLWTPEGVTHAKARFAFDPSGARANHGDRVIGDALLWLGMQEKGVKSSFQRHGHSSGQNKNFGQGADLTSLAYRRAKEAQEKRVKDWW